MDDLSNFEKEFKRVIQNDKTENDFLKQQIASLNQDKIKLQQSTISLDSRMKTCEVEVGVDYS
jgi:mRNA-degrading endonuclease YafQ of YafQ-DinJ toxin-antitoxin module